MRAMRNRFRRRPRGAGGEQCRGNLVEDNDMNDAYDTLGWKAEPIYMAERLYGIAIPNTTNDKNLVSCFIPRTDQLCSGDAFLNGA